MTKVDLKSYNKDLLCHRENQEMFMVTEQYLIKNLPFPIISLKKQQHISCAKVLLFCRLIAVYLKCEIT